MAAGVLARPPCAPGVCRPAQQRRRPAPAAVPAAAWIGSAVRLAQAAPAPGRSASGHAHLGKHPSAACRAAAADRPSGGGELAAYELQVLGRPPQAGPVDIAIQPGPSNSRCIFSGVDIEAPAPAVYAALTSYEALGTFIPGLAENRCLERYADGCKLLQVGQQDLALGFKFCARVCLRITEYPAGMPARLLGRSPAGGPAGAGSSGEGLARLWWPFGGAAAAAGAGSGSGSGGGSGGESEGQLFSEARFLRPRSPLGCATPMDISFELVEGDFAAFKGMWRVQGAGYGASRLSYTLFVRPQPWLLVGLIEQRVQDEIAANLAAVKAHVEAQMAAGARPPPPSLPPPPAGLL